MAGRTRGSGQLAEEVLAVLQDSDVPLSVRDVQERVAGGVLAYTTMLTVLTRLCGHGRAVRVEQSPRKVRFAPAPATTEQAGNRMSRTLRHSQDRQAVLLRFAGDLDDDDARLLREALNRPPRR